MVVVQNLESGERLIYGLALSSYTFAAMVATLALGPLADRFGRKTIIVPSVILFGIGGLLITLSQSFWQVLIWRALQGIGVGGMMNPVVAAIGDMFDVYSMGSLLYSYQPRDPVIHLPMS
ncbi:MAG: MFS transporter [Desulfovermiculus sp.]|nr:MFS transporter [Desulfovermiculus sp.]